MHRSYLRYCKPTGLLILNNLCFVRHVFRISAGNDDNIISYRWRGSYRTVAKEIQDGNTHKSCRNTYLWISTVSVAPRNVHAPQKPNVSRCWIKTTSSILPSRTPTVRITLPRNCLRTPSGKCLTVTDYLYWTWPVTFVYLVGIPLKIFIFSMLHFIGHCVGYKSNNSSFPLKCHVTLFMLS